MNIKKLDWQDFNGHFGKSWIAHTGFKSSYCIYICPNTGKTKTLDLYLKTHEFDSIDLAKEWCQKDFEEKILSNIETKP